MEDRALARLRTLAVMALVAVLAGAVVALTPLLAGAMRTQRTDVDVVNLRDLRNIDDGTLLRELDDARKSAGVLLVIPPDGRFTGQPFECPRDRLPESCRVIDTFDRQVVLADPGVAGELLDDLYGAGAADDDHDGYVRSGRQPLGGVFGWGAAMKVGLGMSVVAAAAFFVLLWAGPRLFKVGPSGPEPYPVPPPGRPGGGYPPVTGPPPVQRRAPAIPQPRPPSTPPARGPSPPPAEPLANDVFPPSGARVVARTHFGAYGGYVDAAGVLLWASLAEPVGRAYPGQPLTVVGPDHGRQSLVVSHHVIEEVRP
ncbi:hypothetical protein [Actinoplanes sp. NPDC023714]|uniref:hypothetical protein n=1 Tax=Actinoplanes sp. NPDC023714 TaxID=3154322 RepID=UPI0033DCC189